MGVHIGVQIGNNGTINISIHSHQDDGNELKDKKTWNDPNKLDIR